MSQQERNAPCACGSGRKYKRCCYLNPPQTGVSLTITQDKPLTTQQELRPRRRSPLTAALLMVAAVSK